MKLQPIVYTANTKAAVAWYGDVLGIKPSYQSDMWTSFDVGDAALGIHHVDELPERGRVEISLVTAEALEMVELRLADHGIEPKRGISDEAFGRSLVLEDPDGTLVQVNEHH